MANYFKTGFILLLISAVSAGLLAVVNGMTVDVIAQAEFEKSVEAYQEIYGDKADTFEPIDEAKKAALVEKYGDIQDVFVAKKGDEVVGYGINHKTNGYGGEMTNAIGLLTTAPSPVSETFKTLKPPVSVLKLQNPLISKGLKVSPLKTAKSRVIKNPLQKMKSP